MNFLMSDGAMLNTFRDDIHFPWSEGHCAIPQLDVQRALKNEEKVIRLVVLVPNEIASDLHNHNIGSVEPRDCAWRPILRKCRKLFR